MKVTLEQWRMLVALVDEGSFAAAAERLQKSQSTVSHGLQRLQEQLGMSILRTEGRRAVLTDEGQLVLRRARALLDEATALEQSALDLQQGWEPEVTLVVDVLFPESILTEVLLEFAPQSRHTRLELVQSSLSGTQDTLLQRSADLAVCGIPPTGFMAEPLLPIPFILVTNPDHALQQYDGGITEQVLKQHRQIVVRDSGAKRRLDAGWLGAEQRWTVTHFQQSRALLLAGLGFAFVPQHWVSSELEQGALKALRMDSGRRGAQSYLAFSDKSRLGPAGSLLARLLREHCSKAEGEAFRL